MWPAALYFKLADVTTWKSYVFTFWLLSAIRQEHLVHQLTCFGRLFRSCPCTVDKLMTHLTSSLNRGVASAPCIPDKVKLMNNGVWFGEAWFSYCVDVQEICACSLYEWWTEYIFRIWKESDTCLSFLPCSYFCFYFCFSALTPDCQGIRCSSVAKFSHAHQLNTNQGLHLLMWR